MATKKTTTKASVKKAVEPQDPFVRVTAHRGILIIQATIEDGRHPDWVPIGPGKIGCVLMDSKKHLGVSKEAHKLLQEIPKSRDDIGDVDWFDPGGKRVFGWIGPFKRLVNPKNASGSSSYKVTKDFVVIPNESDPEAIKAIDEALGAS